jgi:AmmeMemoRadiSam system protein B
MTTPFDPLRNIDAAPVEHDGNTYIAMSDPSGYVEEQLILTPAAFFIAALLDGRNGPGEVQAAFRKQFGGAQVAEGQIQEVVDYLDDHGFLFNRQFEAIRERVDTEFAASDTRPAYFAGRSYPREPEALRGLIDGFFTGENGPGALPGDAPATDAPLAGLIVPHIDFHRGHAGYAHGYQALFTRRKPDVVFIFGVAHAGAPVPVILTRKHFDTPFGRLETDVEIVERLAAACDFDPFEYEARHRTEHSAEFQAVMLAYHYGTDIKIVPILCSGFLTDLDATTPAGNPSVGKFLDTCRDIVGDPVRNCAVIAGADLAHVGRRFGDDFDIDDTVVQKVAGRDHEDLGHITNGAIDPDAFYASVMQDENERNVCGLNCIYATLKALDGRATRASLHHYDYAHDPAGGIVSFASISLE